jgi:hypothetical protein
VVNSSSSESARNVALFLALLATALALGPALAHVLSLINKMDLPRDEYFIAQKAYAGWARLGYLLGIQLIAIAAVAILSRRDLPALTASLLALTAFLAAQVVFWIFTYPANVATMNWTLPPDDWEALRRQWEYSHLAGAALQLLALCALLFAALWRARRI